ncbi:MAG TPA: hypothetical protein VK922_00910 [Gemmatimonadaceae bacterium]|nr:hypothetical protein [Gemmatimonadaceae bacterium]
MPTHTSRVVPALSLALIAAAGCAAERQGNATTAETVSYCERTPGTDVYTEAFDQYMNGLTPTPRRFLSAAGTDSALPEAVFEGVQAKGPTYFYPGDEAGRRQVLEKLRSVGSWPTLLVVWRGNQVQSDSTVAVRLGGHYVGGAEDGTAAPVKELLFACDTLPWQFIRSSEATTP